MRKLMEPTCRNLLRKPLVFGVPFIGLLSLSLALILIQALGQGTQFGNVLSATVALLGYVLLRGMTRFAKPGWEERWIYPIECFFAMREGSTSEPLEFTSAKFPLLASDTLDESDLLQAKIGLEERILGLRKDERLTFFFSADENGATASEIAARKGKTASYTNLAQATSGEVSSESIVYSLVDLPVVTDPLWLPCQLQRLTGNFKAVVTIRGLDSHSVRAQLDATRKRNAYDSGLRSVENDVAFEEATRVLQGLTRGDDCVVEASLVIVSNQELDLDPRYFLREKKPDLGLRSVLGLRPRLHRSFWVRAVTATDLIPNVLDPKEAGVAVLKTPREKALYFDPIDPRLNALHWLLFGASGTGKSVFCGLFLLRMLRLKVPMSVFFIDHGRSFRRMVRRLGGPYPEPRNVAEVKTSVGSIFAKLSQPGGVAGIELSELTNAEKKEATHDLLNQVVHFLKTRTTTYPVYIVMDECWNFMRDEPTLVQQFFREFRKYNGAAVAITQSLSDLLSDESGTSIIQNAPIRIMLRQGEDPAAYRGTLNLNDVEINRLRRLRQEKGYFSECLIKTPFSSRVARLYPTLDEHELLRTDNIREEMIREEAEKRDFEQSLRSSSCSSLGGTNF